jgi:hypothetical protein
MFGGLHTCPFNSAAFSWFFLRRLAASPLPMLLRDCKRNPSGMVNGTQPLKPY